MLEYIFIPNNIRCADQKIIIMDKREKLNLIIHEFKILIQDHQKVIR